MYAMARPSGGLIRKRAHLAGAKMNVPRESDPGVLREVMAPNAPSRIRLRPSGSHAILSLGILSVLYSWWRASRSGFNPVIVSQVSLSRQRVSDFGVRGHAAPRPAR